MTNANNPGIFGPTHMFDPATYESSVGKSGMVSQLVQQHMRMSSAQAKTIISNSTTNIPLKVKGGPLDTDHTAIFMPVRTDMNADYSAFSLTDAEVAYVIKIDKAP